jgi:predicted nuclease with TOPRIM domain
MENGIITLEDQLIIVRDRLRRLEDKLYVLEDKYEKRMHFIEGELSNLEYKYDNFSKTHKRHVESSVQSLCKEARVEYLKMIEDDKRLFELITSRFRRFYQKHI